MSTVQEPNKLYQDATYTRKMCRDSVKGSPAIKRNNLLYLPMPKGYDLSTTSPSITMLSNRITNEEKSLLINAPWYHTNPAYMAYLQRARYPEFVSVARNGLVGIATKQKPEIKLPSSIKYLEEDAGRNKESLLTLFAQLIAEALVMGNVFPMLNVNSDDNTFFIEVVKAEEAIDWDESEQGDGVTFFNIMRGVEERDASDKFKKIKCNYNYVFHKEDKKVVFEEYKDGEKTITPNAKIINMQGRNFTRVPIFPIGAIENVCEPQTPPLNGLGEICLAIYRKDADLSNAQYMTCNPNLVITGVSESAPKVGYSDDPNNELDPEYATEGGAVPVVAGSQIAMQFSNENAKVFYTETDTSALDHMLKAIDKLFHEAAIYSLSLTGKDTGDKEAEGTVKMRQGFQSATLISVVKNVTEQLTNLLKYAAEIEGSSPDQVKFNVNFDFSDKTISAEFFKALIQLFVARGLSVETMLEAAVAAGVPIKSVQEELGRINDLEPAI
jgi:hypothetical protein